VRAMHLMLQQETPDDYVIATGESYTVRSFVEKVFAHLGLDWQAFVRIDPRYFRPAEVDALQGDARKARQALGWEPRVGVDELVRRMVAHDLELARQERTLLEAGHTVAARGLAGE